MCTECFFFFTLGYIIEAYLFFTWFLSAVSIFLPPSTQYISKNVPATERVIRPATEGSFPASHASSRSHNSSTRAHSSTHRWACAVPTSGSAPHVKKKKKQKTRTKRLVICWRLVKSSASGNRCIASWSFSKRRFKKKKESHWDWVCTC